MLLPQLVLIPGLLNDADLWRDQVAGLDGAARPLVADITQGETLARLAQYVLEVAESRFALAGFSLGGIVAFEIMRIAPERVSHLALLDTTMLPDSPERVAERHHLVEMARIPGKFHGFGRKLLSTYLAPQNIENAAMADRVRGMTERLGPAVFARQSLIDRPDNKPLLSGISCPVLVLCGEHDVLTPPALHRTMAAEIASSRLVILPDSGHMTPIEKPEALTAALRQLLKRQ